MSSSIELLHLYVSSGHNYFGHHGKPAGENLVEEVPEIQCVAGRGIQGDRFFNHKENYRGQITFFSHEVYESVCEQFQVWDKPISVFRRNVITRGVDLNDFIGAEFEIQGVRFCGMESCKPCYWMDQAFHPGAEATLKHRGGLRAQILTNGILRTTNLNALRKTQPFELCGN
jgi:MOSC domain-containing protein YiiM